jgi:hypothetical protein
LLTFLRKRARVINASYIGREVPENIEEIEACLREELEKDPELAEIYA